MNINIISSVRFNKKQQQQKKKKQTCKLPDQLTLMTVLDLDVRVYHGINFCSKRVMV